jgi:SAM-dependent methyltransferase
MNREKRPRDADQLRERVRDGYARIAERGGSCCAEQVGRDIGYTEAELGAVPEGANLGLGCGNPTAIDAIEPGQTVLDLGSGAGMDAFLAARQVGPSGRVIGVDMTDAMLEKARENARAMELDNVEFRKGTIEALPLEDASVDVVLSNCVINLSPEKERVFREAFRVLRAGGRLMVSDLVLERPLPAQVLDSMDAYLGCVGGAALRADYLAAIERAGFSEVRVQREARYGDVATLDDPSIAQALERFGVTREQALALLEAVTSLHVFARK